MRLRHLGVKYQIENDHPFAMAIVALAEAADRQRRESTNAEELTQPKKNGQRQEAPIRRAMRTLWKSARQHRKNLLKVANAPPEGIPHREWMKELNVPPAQFRGIQTGIARICVGLGIENPIRSTGYNQANRVYSMEPDASAALRSLHEAMKQRRRAKKTRT